MRQGACALAALMVFAASPVVAADLTGGAAPDNTLLAQVPPPPPPIGTVNWTGPYIGLNGGYEAGAFSNSTVTVGAAAGAPAAAAALPATGGLRYSLDRDYSSAFTGGGQVGYQYQWSNLVFGLEGDFDGSTLDRSVSPTTATSIALGTTIPVSNPNFHLQSDWNASVRARVGYAWDRWLVYATGGVAFADAKMTSSFAQSGAAIAFPGANASQSTTLIGPTIGAGLEYWVAPNLSLAAEYRYADYGSDNFNLGSVATVATSSPAHGVTFYSGSITGHTGLQTQEVLLKINYHFGAPPPPPPPVITPAAAPAPPPVERRVFMVFFDWDRDTITPEGIQIIQQAADAFKAGHPVRIMVTGYTDRSGSPGYNQRLSERRANNVANALARFGVPRSEMNVSGRGENDNRVPTANGVREPQNRRVEIVFP